MPLNVALGRRAALALASSGQVVAADVDGLALHGEQFGDDLRFVRGELFGDGGEDRFQFGVVVLRGEGLRPSRGRGRSGEPRLSMVPSLRPGERSLSRNLPVAASSVSASTLAFGSLKVSAMCSKDGGEREELAERIPAQVVFLDELLDVFRRGAAGTGFEESAAVHERDDREHLGAGADFEDREEVGVGSRAGRCR